MSYDNTKELNCPACGGKMRKIFMDKAGINLDVCLDGCGGIFFDNQEIRSFDEKKEDVEALTKALESNSFSQTDQTADRKCPLCGVVMHKRFASVKHKVSVDECYNCGGIFLDNGELQKIRAQYETEEDGSRDFIRMIQFTPYARELTAPGVLKPRPGNRSSRKAAGFLGWLFRRK